MSTRIQQPQPLTPAQQAVADFIRRYQAEHGGVSPTLQEIADGRGLSKVCIFEHIGELERKGWLTRDKHQSRSIRLLVGVCACCGQKLPKQVAGAELVAAGGAQ